MPVPGIDLAIGSPERPEFRRAHAATHVTALRRGTLAGGCPAAAAHPGGPASPGTTSPDPGLCASLVRDLEPHHPPGHRLCPACSGHLGLACPRRLPVGAAQRHRPLHGAPVLFALRSPVLVEHAAPGRQQPAALWSQHPVGSVDPDPYRLSGRRSHLCPLPPLPTTQNRPKPWGCCGACPRWKTSSWVEP